MKNLTNKIIINILEIIIINHTLYGCLNGKSQQRVTQTTQTNADTRQNNQNNNEDKEIVKLKKQFEQKIAEENIKLETLNLKQKPKTKEEIKKALKTIEDKKEEAKEIQKFLNERPELKNESKAYNNGKIDLNKVEELNQLKKNRIKLEQQAEKIDKTKKVKAISNKDLKTLIKNKNLKTNKNNQPKKNNNTNTEPKSNDDIKSNKNNEPVTTKNDKTNKTELNKIPKKLEEYDPKKLLNLYCIDPDKQTNTIKYTTLKQCNDFVNIIKSKNLNVNKVIQHIEQVNKKIDEILPLKLNSTEKEGARVYKKNKIKFINQKNKLTNIIKPFDDFKNLDNTNYIQKFKNQQDTIARIKTNMETIYKLHNMKALHPTVFFETLDNKQINEGMKKYLTVQNLKNSKIPTQLLKREQLIQQIGKSVVVNLNSIYPYANEENIQNHIIYLKDISKLQKQTEKNYKKIYNCSKKKSAQVFNIDDLIFKIKDTLENKNEEKIKKNKSQETEITFKIADINKKPNGVKIETDQLKEKIISLYSKDKLFTNIVYYDKKIQGTIFNTVNLIIQPVGTDKNNLKNIFEAVISIMKDLFKFETSLNKDLPGKTTYKGFIKAYLNKTNTSNQQHLKDALLEGLNTCILKNYHNHEQIPNKLSQIINLTNYLIGQGLEIDSNIIDQVLKSDNNKIKQYIDFEYNQNENILKTISLKKNIK